METATPRLILQPLVPEDAPELAATVFSDPEVVRHLAHDTRGPDAPLREALRWCAVPGSPFAPVWESGGLGPFAVRSRDPALAPPGSFLGVSGFYMPLKDGRLEGEFFHAFGRPVHGRGVATEAGRAVLELARAHAPLGTVGAIYWERQNPVSGHVMEKLGFRPAGRKSLLVEYPAEKLQAIAGFDLWRYGALPEAARRADTLLTAEKLGILARELGNGTAFLEALLPLVPRGAEAQARAAFAAGQAVMGLARMVWRPD